MPDSAPGRLPTDQCNPEIEDRAPIIAVIWTTDLLVIIVHKIRTSESQYHQYSE